MSRSFSFRFGSFKLFSHQLVRMLCRLKVRNVILYQVSVPLHEAVFLLADILKSFVDKGPSKDLMQRTRKSFVSQWYPRSLE